MPPVLEASTPAAAITGPATAWTIRVTRSPEARSATTRRVCDAITASRSAPVVGPQAERLGDDLARDDEHVTVGQALAGRAHGGHDERGEVRARLHLRHTPERGERERHGQRCRSSTARSRAAPAMSAAASTSVMSSGRPRTARRFCPVKAASSSGATSQPSRKSA